MHKVTGRFWVFQYPAIALSCVVHILPQVAHSVSFLVKFHEKVSVYTDWKKEEKISCGFELEVPNTVTYSITGYALCRRRTRHPRMETGMYLFSKSQRDFWGIRLRAPLITFKLICIVCNLEMFRWSVLFLLCMYIHFPVKVCYFPQIDHLFGQMLLLRTCGSEPQCLQ